MRQEQSPYQRQEVQATWQLDQLMLMQAAPSEASDLAIEGCISGYVQQYLESVLTDPDPDMNRLRSEENPSEADPFVVEQIVMRTIFRCADSLKTLDSQPHHRSGELEKRRVDILENNVQQAIRDYSRGSTPSLPRGELPYRILSAHERRCRLPEAFRVVMDAEYRDLCLEDLPDFLILYNINKIKTFQLERIAAGFSVQEKVKSVFLDDAEEYEMKEFKKLLEVPRDDVSRARLFGKVLRHRKSGKLLSFFTELIPPDEPRTDRDYWRRATYLMKQANPKCPSLARDMLLSGFVSQMEMIMGIMPQATQYMMCRAVHDCAREFPRLRYSETYHLKDAAARLDGAMLPDRTGVRVSNPESAQLLEGNGYRPKFEVRTDPKRDPGIAYTLEPNEDIGHDTEKNLILYRNDLHRVAEVEIRLRLSCMRLLKIDTRFTDFVAQIEQTLR